MGFTTNYNLEKQENKSAYFSMDKLNENMDKIDEILYGEHKQPYSTGDKISLLILESIQEAYKRGYIQGGIDAINRPYKGEV